MLSPHRSYINYNLFALSYTPLEIYSSLVFKFVYQILLRTKFFWKKPKNWFTSANKGKFRKRNLFVANALCILSVNHWITKYGIWSSGRCTKFGKPKSKFANAKLKLASEGRIKSKLFCIKMWFNVTDIIKIPLAINSFHRYIYGCMHHIFRSWIFENYST